MKPSTVADTLVRRLAERTMTRHELAYRAGISPSTINAWCQGRCLQRPDLKNFAAVAQILGLWVSLDFDGSISLVKIS